MSSWRRLDGKWRFPTIPFAVLKLGLSEFSKSHFFPNFGLVKPILPKLVVWSNLTAGLVEARYVLFQKMFNPSERNGYFPILTIPYLQKSNLLCFSRGLADFKLIFPIILNPFDGFSSNLCQLLSLTSWSVWNHSRVKGMVWTGIIFNLLSYGRLALSKF